MPRKVHEEQHAARENQILDATQALVYSKGYAQMTIQDILDAVGISKGAFYHYYGSKRELLGALVQRMADQMLVVLQPVVADPDLAALGKLEAIFASAAAWKSERIELFADLIRVWYADDNALAREKLSRAVLDQFRSLLQPVIEQGIAEGALSTDYPDTAGGIAIALLQSMSTAVVDSLLAWDQQPESPMRLERLVASYTCAIERVLGANRGSLQLVDPEMFHVWAEALSS